MAKLKLGVLGLGEGRSIISAALASEHWELAQLCDLNEPLCRQRCEEFRFPRYTLSLDDMLSDASIDAIGIYTPDPLHARHVRACLLAGKHVICTKPLIDNLADAPSLIDAQKRSGRHVFVGQSTRFFESMQRQRADFDAGKHGELYSVEAWYNADNRWFLQRDWARNGGLKWLFGGLSHPVDLVRWYLPDLTDVMGYGLLTSNGRALGLQHPDSMHFVARTASGKIARISGHYSGPYGNADRDSGMSCVLRGTLGTSQADYSDLRYSTHFSGQGHVQHRMDHRMSYYFRFGGKSHHAGEYQNYIDYFARCLAEGSTPLPDLSEGIVTVATMTAMERSLDTGQPVSVRSVLDEHGLSSLHTM
jgi:predicted dehydrogenase